MCTSQGCSSTASRGARQVGVLARQRVSSFERIEPLLAAGTLVKTPDDTLASAEAGLLSPFLFTEGARTWVGEGTQVVVLPARVGSKAQLMNFLASELQFPDWFGHNWDALDECLADLSWLTVQRVLFVHPELPQLDEPDLAAYLEILADACELELTVPKISAVFTLTSRRRVIELLVALDVEESDLAGGSKS